MFYQPEKYNINGILKINLINVNAIMEIPNAGKDILEYSVI